MFKMETKFIPGSGNSLRLLLNSGTELPQRACRSPKTVKEKKLTKILILILFKRPRLDSQVMQESSLVGDSH